MVTDNHYRWDFIGLSTDEKPTPATSPKVVDGSTFYCSDNSKLYVYCKTQWYEKTATGGGTTYTAGDGITIADDTISVDTTTIQPKLTAGSNITITDNVISAASGSGITVLTLDDYNANSLDWSDTDPSHFNCVALWKLQTGSYIFRPVGSNMYIRLTQDDSRTLGSTNSVIVIVRRPETGSEYGQILYFDGTNSRYVTGINQSGTGGSLTIISPSPVDNLTTDWTLYPLSANQGKVLNDKIEGRVITGTGAPTTSTVGTVGKLYEDTTNGKLYQCTAISGSTYTWTEVGGSGITELTSADYNYPTNNPNGVALWSLKSGVYYWQTNVTVYSQQTTTRNAAGIAIVTNADTAPTLASSARILLMTNDGAFSEGATTSGVQYLANVLTSTNVQDSLNSTSSWQPLSANQGKVLNDKIIAAKASGAPTTSTSGFLGKVYIDSSTNDAYICVDDTANNYVWEKITA